MTISVYQNSNCLKTPMPSWRKKNPQKNKQKQQQQQQQKTICDD